MTQRDVNIQAKIVRCELDRMTRILSNPSKIESFRREQIRTFKRWERIDKVNDFKDWFGESSLRILFAWLALAALGVVFPLVFLEFSVFFGQIWKAVFSIFF